MNILLIISQWSPSQTPNTLRWKPLLSEFQRSGHEVSVLTTNRKGFKSGELIEGIKVHRAGYNTLLDKYYDKKASNNRRNELNSSTQSATIFSGLVQGMINKLWRNRYWPDGSQLFIAPGIELGLDVVRRESITHVISVGLPFSSHLVARAIKRKSDKIHWHMDIQDPFCYSKEFRVNNYNKYKDKNKEEEREAFRIVDSISLTNEVALSRYRELFPEHIYKAQVIPPLFSINSDINYEVITGKEYVHLGYAGSFYENVREPVEFLEFIDELDNREPELYNKIQFHFFGQLDSKSYQQFRNYSHLRRYFVFHGFMKREQAVSGLGQMSIIMNFGNTTDYHLPSKVVDYIFLNKPVLNLISNRNDSTSNFLSDRSIELLEINLSKEDLDNTLEQFKGFVFKKREETKPNLMNVTEFLPAKIASTYLKQLL